MQDSGDRPRFQYFLGPDASSYYYQAGTGVFSGLSLPVIQTTTTPAPLKSDPIGFKDTDVRFLRNAKLHGVFRSLVNPLSFVRDGAAICRYVCYTLGGFEGVCVLTIKQLNHTTQQYDLFYRGAIDFSVKHNSLYTFQAEAMDMGLAAILKAKENTPYEHVIEDVDAVRAYMDGISLRTTYNWGVLGNSFNQTVLFGFTLSDRSFQTYPVEPEGSYSAGIANNTSDIQMVQGAFAGGSAEQNNYEYEAMSTQIAEVTVTQPITLTNGLNGGNNSGPVRLRIKVLHWINATSATVKVATPAYPTPVNVGATVSFSPLNGPIATVNMAVNDRLYVTYDVVLASNVNQTPAQGSYGFSYPANSSAIQIGVLHSVPDSIIKGYWFWQVVQKHVAAMTGGQNTAYSDLLTDTNLTLVDSKPARTLVTSGDALRRLNINTTGGASEPSIKVTFDDICKDAFGCWMAGVGIEVVGGNEVLRMEHLSHFYDTTTIIAEVGVITKADFYYSQDHLYKLMKVGSPVQDYDRVNGRDEFNTTSTLAFPVIRPTKDWETVTGWRDDMYGIEFCRANLAGKKTTDANTDNTTFVIELADNPISVPSTSTGQSGNAYPLSRKQNDPGNYALGLIGPAKAFNLTRTPKRKFGRLSPLAHVSLFQQDSKIITFQVTDKNPDVESKLSGTIGAVVENADVPISTLPAPLFLPIIFQFETMVPLNITELIAQNPYGLIGATYKGVTYYGHIDEVGIKPGTRETYTWKLLLSRNTDVSTLQH